MSNRRQIGADLLREVEEELRQAMSELDLAQQKVMNLRAERDAATVLAGAPRGSSLSAANGGGTPFPVVGTLKDLIYPYLRNNAPVGGLTAVDLHKSLVATGAQVGRRNYIYHVLTQLEKDGFVRKASDGRYTAIVQAAGRSAKQREVVTH